MVKLLQRMLLRMPKVMPKTPHIKTRSELSGIEILTLIMLNFSWDSIAFQGRYLTSMQMILSLLFKNNDLIIKIRIFA